MTDSVLRPPAVPLVVHDPYLSVWSTRDNLYDDHTRHWTGAQQGLFGMVSVDGDVYHFMGREWSQFLPTLPQTDLKVTPTRTIYTFQNEQVELVLTFVTPLLPHDLDVMARPLTYLDFAVTARDGQAHNVDLYVEIAANWVVNTPVQRVVWGRHQSGPRELLWMGTSEQPVLAITGDDVRIDWGYLYTTTIQDASGVLGFDGPIRSYFLENGSLPDTDATDMPCPVDTGSFMPVTAWTIPCGPVDDQGAHRQLVIAYDDQFSVEYFHRKLRPYWRRDGMDAGRLLAVGCAEYEALHQRCVDYDNDLMDDLQQVGGEEYAQLAALAFRQCIAAHKLVADLDGTPLFFSKENFSNGCMDTVDVTYPSSPFFLLLNPALLEAQLTPIMDYAQSGRWQFPFAPHDIGRYPHANGQVYGGGEASEVNQMPVEECGNMLILVAALCKAYDSAEYAQRYWGTLTQWVDYLVSHGLDPENQLCTDDFAGHLAHNVNLSVKAIMAVAGYAYLCDASGLADDAKTYRGHAEEMVQQWLKMADDGDHYRLAFDRPGTWSQKYNLVWDKILDLDLFPGAVFQKELAYYQKQQAQYGLPLDNRSAYTKLDWIIWSASLSDSKEQFQSFVQPVYKWLGETESRVPLTDWYFTDSGKQRGFQARSVVGGVYIPLLYHDDVVKKWHARLTHTS